MQHLHSCFPVIYLQNHNYKPNTLLFALNYIYSLFFSTYYDHVFFRNTFLITKVCPQKVIFNTYRIIMLCPQSPSQPPCLQDTTDAPYWSLRFIFSTHCTINTHPYPAIPSSPTQPLTTRLPGNGGAPGRKNIPGSETHNGTSFIRVNKGKAIVFIFLVSQSDVFR